VDCIFCCISSLDVELSVSEENSHRDKFISLVLGCEVRDKFISLVLGCEVRDKVISLVLGCEERDKVISPCFVLWGKAQNSNRTVRFWAVEI
jgi:hypothetical protein